MYGKPQEIEPPADGAYELLRRLATEFCAANQHLAYQDMRSAFYEHVTGHAELVALYGGRAWLARKDSKAEIWRAYDFLKHGGKHHAPPWYAKSSLYRLDT